MARRRDRYEMLGPTGVEIAETVDPDESQERLGVRAFNDQLIHVMRLIEQHRTIAPRALFIAPVGKFRSNDRVHIHPNGRIAQHLHRIGMLRHNCTKAGHFFVSVPVILRPPMPAPAPAWRASVAVR